ncbi:hypothetical protein [Melittangium boletus]|uniref:Uncharacterized protein n=1 Tax=Melittangium boletus DSM 14713 TaxID=1294270 RepID=A0A250IHI5_9BACT|nr:hypothetical protein [Melittangium boletus]ATB30627.1 hypothetical protein MEBOL_004088 [Melittangium boletus DSM 14713]
MLTLDAHPLLDAVAFEATFPAPLSQLPSPDRGRTFDWYREVLERLGAVVEPRS